MSNTPPNKMKPYYMLQPGAPEVIGFEKNAKMLEDPSKHTISMSVDPEAVDAGDVGNEQLLIFILQHYPKLVEKYIFSIEYKFPQIAGSELYYSEDDWKMDPKYYRWFFRLSHYPPIIFFIRDRDARFYFLVGDILADEKVDGKWDEKKQKEYVVFTDEQTQLMASRLFNSCRFFYIYCHVTGFDPTPYIEALIAEFDMSESSLFKQVCDQYEEDKKTGLYFKTSPEKI